jgi:hypothetical protein
MWNNIGTITRYDEQIQISFNNVSYHHLITAIYRYDQLCMLLYKLENYHAFYINY